MRYIISERQYRLLIEQESSDNWLYNWFRDVPEEKIRNTFAFFNPNSFDNFFNAPQNIKNRIPRPNYYTKIEILDLLSKKPKINNVDKNTFDFINGDTNTGALYIGSEFAEKFQEYTTFMDDMEKELSKYEKTPEISSRLKELESTRKRIEHMAKYAGSILIPSDINSRIKGWGMSEKDIVRHEEMHGLYDITQNVADNIIKSLCKSSKCNKEELKSVTKNTEVYSYLMTIRSKFNMSPTDVVKSAKVLRGPKDSEIILVVDRNGKSLTLKDYLPNNSAVLKAMECCTGDIGNSIKVLHNTLAMNDEPANDSLMA
jgi:hypothetical protein